MRCITIQNKVVYERLMEEGIYVRPSLPKELTSDIKKAYLHMKECYQYENMPIFLAPVGYKVEFYGARFDQDSIALELEIPDEFLKIQNYYDWSDFIYFINAKSEFKNWSDRYKDVYAYGREILFSIENEMQMNLKDAFQCTTEILKKEWILSTATDLSRIKYLHNGSGGRLILSELKEYVNYNQ